ncbi:MAG: hypothetical protein IT427_11035 [Pirellulales bacterium]|nr:hypothetical protein [Pirellulales bacterium]
MYCLQFTTIATGLVLLSAQISYGQVSLSLSSAADLDHLVVGQPVTFEINLSGIASGQEVDFIAATVVYDSSLLSPPVITAGDIVPSPADFFSLEDAGLADATFQTFGVDPSDHILADGTFFTFEVTVLAAGSGSLGFDFVDATRFNAQNPLSSIPLTASDGPPLDFVAVVPEPRAAVLALTAAATLLWFGRQRSA